MKQFKGIVESPTPPPETDVLWMTTIPVILILEDDGVTFKGAKEGPFKVIALFNNGHWYSLIAPTTGLSEPIYDNILGRWGATKSSSSNIKSVDPRYYSTVGNLLTLPTNASLENVINRVNAIIDLLNNTLNALYDSELFSNNVVSDPDNPGEA